jgi:hypothetical protein
MQETIGCNPSGAKRRDLPDEDKQGSHHSHRMLWTVAVLTLAGLIADAGSQNDLDPWPRVAAALGVLQPGR